MCLLPGSQPTQVSCQPITESLISPSTHMFYPGPTPVQPLSHPCPTQVLPLCHPGPTPVPPQFYPGPILVLPLSYPGPTPVPPQYNPCLTLVRTGSCPSLNHIWHLAQVVKKHGRLRHCQGPMLSLTISPQTTSPPSTLPLTKSTTTRKLSLEKSCSWAHVCQRLGNMLQSDRRALALFSISSHLGNLFCGMHST